MKGNTAKLRRILAAAAGCILLLGSGAAAVRADEEISVQIIGSVSEAAESAGMELTDTAETEVLEEDGSDTAEPAETEVPEEEGSDSAEVQGAAKPQAEPEAEEAAEPQEEPETADAEEAEDAEEEESLVNASSDKVPSVLYRTHVQTYGWETDWKTNGVMSGTQGQAKRLEAIQIELTGADAAKYDVWYCVHAQHFGWLNWAKNGAEAGTAGFAYRLEGIRIRILPKGSGAPANEGSHTAAFYSKSSGPAMSQSSSGIAYNTHVQTYGWQDYAYNGAMSGTSGQSKRLEGIHIALTGQPYGGDVEYRTHVQTYGWQDWKKNGQMAGTSGQAKRLEAIQIRLTGEMAAHFDIWYRVHAQHFGWMGWAKNGARAGTAGYAYRLEAIQIVLKEKGSAAPASDLGGCRQTAAEAYSENREKTFPTLQSLGIPYGGAVDSKVDSELRKLYALASQQGIDIDSLSGFDRGYVITQYIGSFFSYRDGSHTAETMLDTGGGTCYAFADLTYCFARKLGLTDSWLTIPGRHIDHNNKTYGSLHRSVVALIDGKYYDLDSDIYYEMAGVYDQLVAEGYEVDPDVLLPEQISRAYADYLTGKTNTRPASVP